MQLTSQGGGNKAQGYSSTLRLFLRRSLSACGDSTEQQFHVAFLAGSARGASMRAVEIRILSSPLISIGRCLS